MFAAAEAVIASGKDRIQCNGSDGHRHGVLIVLSATSTAKYPSLSSGERRVITLLAVTSPSY